jgi:hypothetical protein
MQTRSSREIDYKAKAIRWNRIDDTIQMCAVWKCVPNSLRAANSVELPKRSILKQHSSSLQHDKFHQRTESLEHLKKVGSASCQFEVQTLPAEIHTSLWNLDRICLQLSMNSEPNSPIWNTFPNGAHLDGVIDPIPPDGFCSVIN